MRMRKNLGETDTFVQTFEGGVCVLVYCTRDADSDYVTKIMSSHGLLEKVQDRTPPGGLSMENGKHSSIRSHSVIITMISTG